MFLSKISPHPPTPCGGRPSEGPGGGGMGWGGWDDINIRIDINTNIYLHIIINMRRPQVLFATLLHFYVLDMHCLKKACFCNVFDVFDNIWSICCVVV